MLGLYPTSSIEFLIRWQHVGCDIKQLLHCMYLFADCFSLNQAIKIKLNHNKGPFNFLPN